MTKICAIETINKKLSHRRDSARCGCRHICLWSNLSSVHKPTSIKFTYTLLVYHRLVCNSYHTSPRFQVELKKDGWARSGVGGHALVSGCPEHWTVQP